MVLVDSSVWIEVFRRPSRFDLESQARFDAIVTCPPIVAEILQGFRDERAHRLAREALLALPMIESPMPMEAFLDAAELYRAARRAGITPRSGVDCLIAACALRADAELLHSDRDFGELARICPLRERDIRLA